MLHDMLALEGSFLDEFERMRREMDRLFDRGLGRASIRAVARGSFPAINVGTTPDAFHVYAFAPGVDTKTLDLSIQQNLLTITGERKTESAAQAGYHLRERFSGDFKRVIGLPDSADPNKVEASYRDGILKVVVGKREAAKPRQISVQS